MHCFPLILIKDSKFQKEETNFHELSASFNHPTFLKTMIKEHFWIFTMSVAYTRGCRKTGTLIYWDLLCYRKIIHTGMVRYGLMGNSIIFATTWAALLTKTPLEKCGPVRNAWAQRPKHLHHTNPYHITSHFTMLRFAIACCAVLFYTMLCNISL